MFIKCVRVVEDGFYFRGIILLTCPKKGTLGMQLFTVNNIIFIMLSQVYTDLCNKETNALLHFRFAVIAILILHCIVFSIFALI